MADNYEDTLFNNTKTAGAENGNRRRAFASNIFGSYIVNAVTGVKYNWKVGSKEENILWKVCDARCYNNADPSNYFYDSPYEAMAHRRSKYSQESIDNWQSRSDIYRTNYNNEGGFVE